MRIWVSKNSAVSVLEQLVSQVVLGIVSGELPPGSRIPSTRELSRRFHIHSNTVCEAYRRLENQGWIETRQGSGSYVVPWSGAGTGKQKQLDLDARIAGFLRECQSQGFGLQDLRARIQRWLEIQPPDHFLLIESDPILSKILATEVANGGHLPVTAISPEACADSSWFTGAIVLVLALRDGALRMEIPPQVERLVLRLRSAPAALQEHNNCDAAVALELPTDWPVHRLKILADESFKQLRQVSNVLSTP